MEERINCKKCGTSILRQTAEKNEGLCKPCLYQVTGAKPVKQVKASSAAKRLEHLQNRKFGFVCNQCQSVEIGGWKSLDNRKCPTCSDEMTNMELVEVLNKPRLAYLGIWTGFAAICFVLWAILKPSVDWDRSGTVALFVLGWLGLVFPIAHLFAAAGGTMFFGFGGPRWLTHKLELKSPPPWFSKLTFPQALLRESLVSLAILVSILVISLISIIIQR